ncbi:MAG: pyridoxamine 5'-phosphate oxidase [Saprospiraceae bacterium]
MKLFDMRREYQAPKISLEDMNPDPFTQFEQWFQEAQELYGDHTNAMSLATANAQGAPSLRTVLLKSFDRTGFVFFTNYGSRKAREIGENPQVALLFPWIEMHRQVIITGAAKKVSAAESLSYFISRPRGSQLGAWISQQSSVLTSRQALMSQWEHMKEKFKDGHIPLPDFWGGYRVTPEHFEFWQGQENRLHDRFYYSTRDDGGWVIEILSP